LGDEIEALDENIIVLSDEAHRGEEGVSGINIRSAFKHAYFFGFTGTPIDLKHLIRTVTTVLKASDTLITIPSNKLLMMVPLFL
jgi:type I site-specific restriction-modification system R (restriction) subunit